VTQVIVENTFEVPLTDEDLRGMNERGNPCLHAYGVTWRVSYLSVDRRRMVCHFEAADAEAVRTALRSAAIRFDRVWATEVRLPAA
jgi:Protein of unknown function (DUF4242)